MLVLPCHRCHAPAYAAGLCAACIRQERAAIKPFVAMAVDCLQALGWADLAGEAQRRYALYEIPEGVPYAELMQ